MYQSALLTNVNAKRINQHTNTSRAAEVYEEPEFSYNDVLYDEMSRNVKRHKRNTSNNSRNGNSANVATTPNTSSKISMFSNPMTSFSLGGTQSSSYMTSLSATNTSSNDLTKDDILNWLKKLIDEKTVVKGDANGDGKVDLNDLKVMVDRMFDDKVDIKMKNVDFDDDGKISLKDISKVIDILLEKGESDDPIEPDPPPKQILKGDVNGDGKVTQADVYTLEQYYVGNTKDINMDNADMNDDGKISIIDISKVKQLADELDPQVLKGDANGDGKVNYRDVELTTRRLSNSNVNIDMKAADMDNDGEITLSDFSEINRLTKKYEDSFQSIRGDSNGDGVVNEKDFTNVKNYINNVNSSDDFVKKNSDINGDGRVDDEDLQGVRDILDGFNINYSKTTLRGDVDGDGKVTKADAQLISDYNNRKATNKNFYINNADFNNDGKIDSKDVEAIENNLKPKHKINYSTGGHLGDIDGNGRIEISDAVFLNNFIKDNVNTDKEVFINNTDVNRDGKVDINDVNAITDLLRNVKKAERLVPVYTNGQQNGDFIKTGDNFILLEQQGDSLKVQYTATDGNEKIGWVHESIFVPEPPPDPDPKTIVDPPFTSGRAIRNTQAGNNPELTVPYSDQYEGLFAGETFTVKAMTLDRTAFQVEYDSIYGGTKTRWVSAADIEEYIPPIPPSDPIPESLQILIDYWTKKSKWIDHTYLSTVSQCKEFASYIFDQVYGVGYIGGGSTTYIDGIKSKGINYNNFRINLNYPNKVKLVNSSMPSNVKASAATVEQYKLTADSARELFKDAKPGDFIQIRRGHGGAHSAIFLGHTENGIKWLDANADNNNGIAVQEYTYDELVKIKTNKNTGAKYQWNVAMSIYRAN